MIYGGPAQINSVPVATTYDATISSSTEITLNTATRLIQVTAIDKPIFLSWGTADASTSNFDLLVPANQSYFLSVPYQSDGKTLFTAVNFIEASATALLAVAEY